MQNSVNSRCTRCKNSIAATGVALLLFAIPIALQAQMQALRGPLGDEISGGAEAAILATKFGRRPILFNALEAELPAPTLNPNALSPTFDGLRFEQNAHAERRIYEHPA